MPKIQDLILSFLFVIILPIAVVAADATRPNPEDGPTDIYASIVIVDFDTVRDADQSLRGKCVFQTVLARPTPGREKFFQL